MSHYDDAQYDGQMILVGDRPAKVALLTTEGPVRAVPVASGTDAPHGFLWAATGRGDRAAGFGWNRDHVTPDDALAWWALLVDAQQADSWDPQEWLTYWFDLLDDPGRPEHTVGEPRDYASLTEAFRELLPDAPPPAV